MAIVSKPGNKDRNSRSSNIKSPVIATEGIETLDNEELAKTTVVTPELFGGHLPVGEYVADDEIDDVLVSDHQHEHEDQSFTHKMVILGAVVLPLIALVAALVLAMGYGMVNWLDITMLIGGWYLTGLGITIGYHRMLTHGSFKTSRPVRFFWSGLGAMAAEGSPIDWCMVHRRHHQFSDDHGDPHSPHLHGEGLWNSIKGFWHAHTGWLFKNVWSKNERKRYIPDLIQEEDLMFIDRHYYMWVIERRETKLMKKGTKFNNN
jgi:stearoyl-CoA desaturase (delta-9 desaturase)